MITTGVRSHLRGLGLGSEMELGFELEDSVYQCRNQTYF